MISNDWYVAAAYGYVDAVVEPNKTREYILHSLEISGHKHEERPVKKHGIPPF